MLNLQRARRSISLATQHFPLLIAILSPLHENHNKRYLFNSQNSLIAKKSSDTFTNVLRNTTTFDTFTFRYV